MNFELLFIVAAIIGGILLVALLAVLYRRNNAADISSFADNLLRAQAELSGRLSLLNENNTRQQAQLMQSVNEQKLSLLKIMDERLLEVTKNVGQGLQQSAEKTGQTLHELHERLVKIDVAQQKISNLSEQVVSLQEVLTNKQARGAFGEIQLNDLVTSIQPTSANEFKVV